VGAKGARARDVGSVDGNRMKEFLRRGVRSSFLRARSARFGDGRDNGES